MQKILFPIQSNDKGPEVRNLHDALLELGQKMTVKDFQSLFKDPDFRATFEKERREETYGEATRQIISAFQVLYMQAPPSGLVNEATANALNSLLQQYKLIPADPATPQVYSVQGAVYDEWIEPMKGAPVTIFDKDIRSEHLLGEGETNDKGGFSITYSGSELTRTDKGGADLIVRIYGQDGAPLYTSPVNYNAAAQLAVNVNLGPRPYMGPSQFVKVLALVRGCSGELPIYELTETGKVHDLSFIINKTGIAANILLQLVAAFRFEKWTGLEAEVYYGILSSNGTFPAANSGSTSLPADVDTTIEKAYIAFWNNAVTGMLGAFQQAADNNVVTYKLVQRKEKIGDELQKLKTAPPQEDGSTQSLPPVYTQIATAGLDTAQQQSFLNLYSVTDIDPSFWTTLAQDPAFQGEGGTAVINKLQAVFQLAGWTANNTALTAYIVKTYSISAPQDFSSLIGNTPADWVGIVEASGAVSATGQGGTGTSVPAPSVQDLANSIAANIEGLFPMAVFADRFTKATTLTMTNRPYLTGVLQSTDFNLLTSSAVEYLNTYTQKNPLPSGADQTMVGRQLMSMQRVYKISQSADTSMVLMGNNIQSARQIYAMGPGNFVSQYQDKLGGADAARQVFDQAAEIHTGAAYLTGRLISMLNNPAGNVMLDYNGQLAESSLTKNYPDLANLFGMPASYCKCDNCSSWLGTPAYLADLLDFLSLRLTTGGSEKANARQVLLATGRRSDIADIDLDCENANTELPYIDVVNELLEDYIIPPVACLKVKVKNQKDYELWIAANLKPGRITHQLYEMMQLIVANPKTPICNLSLLTDHAVLSSNYWTENDNFPLWYGTTEEFTDPPQLVIRDKFITLKLYVLLNQRADDPVRGNGGNEGGRVRLACTAVDGVVKVKGKGTLAPSGGEIHGDTEAQGSAEAQGGSEVQGNTETQAPDTAVSDTLTFTIVVQEIHQTHLSTDVINTNPEYINTNVYNCLGDPFNSFKHNLWDLYPTIIPMSLPFDLYFTESNVYLNKMGMKRYTLIEIFEKQKTGPGGDSLSIGSIVLAYLGLAVGDEEIIFVDRKSEQAKFWWSLAGLTQVPVNLFLTISRLSFTQLQDLLTLAFINPLGDSIITGKPAKISPVEEPPMENCNTADMLLIGMGPEKFDHINRFLRLWRKVNLLTPVTMDELDDCIMSPALGNGALDGTFAINFYYFLNVMSLMSATATQALVLYQDIGTKGDSSLYQQLFQNRQISNPLVQAFRLPLAGTTLITDTHSNPGAVAVILTACGIASADLSAIMALNNQAYAKLTLDNLSFSYACGLVANALSISVSDLLTLTGLLNSNPLHAILGAPVQPATPKSTFEFITAFNALQQAGFDVDGLNYALTAQSTATPSLVPAATDVVSGLGSIRSAIQAAVTATTPQPDPKGSLLTKWLADPDLGWDQTMAASLLAILATGGTANYSSEVQDNLRFLQLLQENYVEPSVTAFLEELPAIQFPDSGIGGILYNNTLYYLFYDGTMTPDLHAYLRGAAPDAVSQAAVDSLYQQSQGCWLSAALLSTATLGTPPAWVASASLNTPAFWGGTGVLRYTGVMAGPDYTALLAQSADPTYGCALAQLFLSTQGAAAGVFTYVQLTTLPAISLPDTAASGLSYNPTAVTLSFTGAMSASDALALLGLAPDASWQTAIATLYTTAVAGQTVSVPLTALPAGWSSFPDLTGMDGLSFSPGMLSFSGTMTAAQQTALTALSGEEEWVDAIYLLYTGSQAAAAASAAGGGATGSASAPPVTSVPLTALPSGVTLPDTGISALSFAPPALCYDGQMNTTVQTALDNLSGNSVWTGDIQSLFTNTQSTVVATAPIAALPAGLTAASFPLYGVSYTPASGSTPATLGYTGPMSDYVLDLLIAANADPNWAAAVTVLYQNAQASLVAAVQFVLPTGITDGNFFGITGIKSLTTAGVTVLTSTGQMSTTIKQKLLGISQDPTYIAAVGYLFGQTSALIPASLPPIVLPLPDTNISGVTYTPFVLSFSGTPNYDCMDEFNLQQLSDDPAYQGAIGWIYTAPPATPIAAGSVGAVLAALPAITLPAASSVSWSGGELGYVGQMSSTEYNILAALSSNPSYQAALNTLYTDSQITSVVSLNLAALPAGVTVAGLEAEQVTCQQASESFILSFTGVMSAATEAALQALSADADYQTAITGLYTQSQTTVQATVQLAALPPITLPSALLTYYDPNNNVLYYSGTLPMPAGTLATLNGLSAAPEYQQALAQIALVAPNPNTYTVVTPPPQTPFASDGFSLASGSISWQGGTIGFTATMSFGDYQGLLALSTDADYWAALTDLFVRSQSSGGSTIQSTDYLSLPPLSFPAIYTNQLSYTAATQTLTLRGMMAMADQSALLSFGSNAAYQEAINGLYAAVNPDGDVFSSITGLYDAVWPLQYGAPAPTTPGMLYEFFLDAISVVYQPIKEAEALAAQVVGNFGVTAAVATVLVTDLPDMFLSMTMPSFAANSKAINPDPNQCAQALWYLKLARMGFLVNSFSLAAADTDWWMNYADTVGGIDLTFYPSSAEPVLPFSAWTVSNGLSTFQKTYKPLTVTNPASPAETMTISVYSIITGAMQLETALSSGMPNPGALLGPLEQLTGWSNSELLYLLAIGQPDLPNLSLNPLELTDTGNPAVGCATDLDDISILLRLSACFTAAAQMKVVPSRCVNWVIDPLTAITAVDIKQALKSQYPNASTWPTVITPLTNTLRQSRRDALVAYLLSDPVSNVWGIFEPFADEFAIYGNFLIDVEMQACQPTTRVIQAYCSIQSFVQRCFLSLEPGIVPNLTADPYWAEWAWMGTAEGWYEARYTFLFPENLVLPQTLPNQTSFFQDLQNSLTQGPVTADMVESAFEDYVESLDDIARLQVSGMWYDDATGNLHVFACTYGGNPQVYYYRMLDAFQQWGPWQQITADISGDQIIPVMQNGRLYLYWPVFSQTSDDDKSGQTIPSSSSGGTAPPPKKYWQIQMAFSEYKGGQWSGKKLSKDYLVSTTIQTTPNSPVIYPDTTDFVFVALDIPPVLSGDAVTAVQSSLVINNTMAIACFQYRPSQETATIVLEFFGTFPTSYSIPVNSQTQSFQLSDLVSGIQGTLIDGAHINIQQTTAVVLLNSSDTYQTINNLLAGLNPRISIPIFPVGITITVASITTSVQANSDYLQILTLDNPNGFLLDPLRGYPTPIDLFTIRANTININHLWFKGSGFDNNLVVGSTPLVNDKGVMILNPANSLSYSNLLPLQMGLWAKFDCIEKLFGNIVDFESLGILMPWFYQDTACTFYVNQATKAIPTLPGATYSTYEDVAYVFSQPSPSGTLVSQIDGLLTDSMEGGPYYQFNNFYHPFAHFFIRIVATYGMAGVVSRPIQLTGDPDDGTMAEVESNYIHAAGYKDFSFTNVYGPSGNVVNIDSSNYTGGYPVEQMDFDPGTAYSQYNWELFFHSVMLSGILLSQNQQFAAADACYKLIFNCTDTSGDPSPQRYWVTKPFYKNNLASLSIEDLITLYTLNPLDPLVQAFQTSVNLWKLDPYDPHMLALYRITPYMYATFMKYLDNLIAWANFNYAQYTMESVNFAIQLFMLALEMLGAKPKAIPPVVKEPICTYNQLESNLDGLIGADGEGYLSDPIVQVENLLPPAGSGGKGGGTGQQVPMLNALFFCIPPNTVLLGYWDVVETQLKKINNCLNIQGQFQPLSPFPNIPGMGMDGSGISDFGGVLPNYRFTVMIQKATELCNEVKSLGASLLSALEKQDVEGLALLHASQEIAVQQSIDLVKQMQITDAQLGLQNLQAYQQLINDKITYYSGLIQNGGLIPLEQQALSLNQFSLAMEGPITAASILGSVLKLIPQIQLGAAGFGGSPTVNASIGGQELGGAVDCFVQFMSFLSHFADKSASLANTNAGYTRRLADWTFQLGQANDESAQVAVQLQSAQEKIDIATQDEQNQQLLIQNAEDVQTFLQNKYTNQQLYSWMVTQISNVYFQSYQLAYSFAKQAEVCFGYELGVVGASYINYGYWDTLHKGLLSGEALMSSLKQMETDYYNLNIREYELTRQISLAQLDPVALLQLKSAGSCFVNIPEELFDLDYPGQYFRRIKHISVTLPGVVGPYTPVCLKMTLMSNTVRVDNTPGSVNTYPRHTDSKGNPTYDSRFLDNYAAVQYIATSTGVNDSGLFEMNLHDERYLPFERGGAIATWLLEFTSVYQQFDWDSVTDLILQYGYTSRDGGALFQAVAAQSVQTRLKTAMTSSGLTLMRGFSARRDFPTQWYKFLNPANPADPQQLVMDITERFPFFTQGLTIKITQVVVVAEQPAGVAGTGTGALANLYLSGEKLNNALINFGQDPDFGLMLYSLLECKDSPGVWTISNGTAAAPATAPVLNTDVCDLNVIFYYTLG